MANKRATDLMAEINAAMKSNALTTANDPKYVVTTMPTGVLPIDVLLQGGLPRGRFVEIYGPYSSLKSYIGYKAIASIQRAGGVAALLDNEHAFDEGWARSLGVNVDELLIQRPETGELGLDTVEALVRAKVDLIVFDSVASALPQTEQQKRLHNESLQPARLAQLMSLAMRKLTASNSQTTILWINQTRVNIGVTFGSSESIPGGKALGYYASIRINVRKVGMVTESKKVWNGDKWEDQKVKVGQKFKATTEKSKLNAPFQDTWFTWNLKTGEIDNAGYLIAQGLETGIITVKGNTWSFGKHKAVGKDKFKALVDGNSDAQFELSTLLGFEMYVGTKVPEPVQKTKRRVVKKRL